MTSIWLVKDYYDNTQLEFASQEDAQAVVDAFNALPGKEDLYVEEKRLDELTDTNVRLVYHQQAYVYRDGTVKRHSETYRTLKAHSKHSERFQVFTHDRSGPWEREDDTMYTIRASSLDELALMEKVEAEITKCIVKVNKIKEG